jgi:hypothetical protein
MEAPPKVVRCAILVSGMPLQCDKTSGYKVLWLSAGNALLQPHMAPKSTRNVMVNKAESKSRNSASAATYRRITWPTAHSRIFLANFVSRSSPRKLTMNLDNPQNGLNVAPS